MPQPRSKTALLNSRMKLLLDQGLLRSAPCCAMGVDAVHTGEIGSRRLRHQSWNTHGGREGRTVVTLDADFHMLLALSGMGPRDPDSIERLQLMPWPNSSRASWPTGRIDRRRRPHRPASANPLPPSSPLAGRR